MRETDSGERVIPFSLLQEKLAEQKVALREEMETRSNRPRTILDELQETCDDLDTFFLRDLSLRQRCELFRTMIEYYKENPSADRARLLTALKNKQAEMVAGVSSKTMARARNPDSNIRSAGKRRRLTQGGLSKEEVEQIAFEACMDSRFCEVRSWIERSAQSESRRWECVGLVPIFTMRFGRSGDQNGKKEKGQGKASVWKKKKRPKKQQNASQSEPSKRSSGDGDDRDRSGSNSRKKPRTSGGDGSSTSSSS